MIQIFFIYSVHLSIRQIIQIYCRGEVRGGEGGGRGRVETEIICIRVSLNLTNTQGCQKMRKIWVNNFFLKVCKKIFNFYFKNEFPLLQLCFWDAPAYIILFKNQLLGWNARIDMIYHWTKLTAWKLGLLHFKTLAF